ncbi:helix-turn-helix domain-containing protein [Paenibacillus polysaccharolyticus]|uniref:helix-turn-helix domain-containing protein n=1 Tax=Paenibacillus polysaccharolyticus TaxID=582692 RepID=UPI00209FF524|nr:helix-turn-helix domain-containing protein [Paenibacillus polysaccharolyticus]MCP1135441.1 helix-turn-helix domain-containing protein [Paenibacillus polysaccharolyticus]
MNESFPVLTETSSLPLLSSMCRVRRGKNFRIQGITVSRPILCLILKGNGLLVLDDIVYEAQAGELFLIKPGLTIDAVAHSGITEFLMLSMEQVNMQRVRGKWNMTASSYLPFEWQAGKMRIRHEQQAAERMAKLYDSYRGELADHFVSIHSQLHELLQFLSEHRLEENLEKVDPALERSISYMRRFMSEGISMDHLAKIAGLTPSSYSRSFKKAKGMSPTDYLNRLRIEEAKKQLIEENCVLKEVAESVGYGNEYYFSRKFKQMTGIAPSIYMKKHRLRVATISSAGFDEHLHFLGLKPVESLNLGHSQNKKTAEQERNLTNQLEQLRKAKPDLIIGDVSCQPYTDQLKGIAPVVIVEVTDDWKETHIRLAELTGREKQAKHNFKELALHRLEVAPSSTFTSSRDRKHVVWTDRMNSPLIHSQAKGSTLQIPSQHIQRKKKNLLKPVVMHPSTALVHENLSVIGR